MSDANNYASAECADSLDAPSLSPGCDERALKAIDALHAHLASGFPVATTGAFTGASDERDINTPQTIAKRQSPATSTNQSDGELLTHAESTAALRKVLDSSAKIVTRNNLRGGTPVMR